MPSRAVDRAGGHVRGVGPADEHEDPLDAAVAGPPTCPRQGELGAQQRVRRSGEDARAGWHQGGVGGGTRAEVLVQHEVHRKRPIGEVIDGHQRRPGHAAAHPREPVRAEAVVVADDEGGLTADRRADLGRFVLRLLREVEDRDPGPGKAGGQPVGEVAGRHRRPPAARHEPFGQGARSDQVTGPHRLRGIGPQQDVARRRRRAAAQCPNCAVMPAAARRR